MNENLLPNSPLETADGLAKCHVIIDGTQLSVWLAVWACCGWPVAAAAVAWPALLWPCTGPIAVAGRSGREGWRGGREGLLVQFST